MLRSMTGFGEAVAETPRLRIHVEVRGVNHRFSDLRLRLPAELQSWEGELRRQVAERVRRGRVDVVVVAEHAADAEPRPTLNRALLEEALAAARWATTERGVPGRVVLADLLSIPGMFRVEAVRWVPGAAEREALERALAGALDAFDAARGREGETLRAELERRIATLRSCAAELRSRASCVPGLLQQRLLERLRTLSESVALEPGRLEQEAAFLAERCDVTEELVRLEGHLGALAGLLERPDGEPLGKRLDFLLQEVNRESNTLSAKAADLELTRHALTVRLEAERMREQAQNVE